MYIVEFQSRLVVFIKWAFQDLTSSRGARLITGAANTDFDFNHEIACENCTTEMKADPVGALAH